MADLSVTDIIQQFDKTVILYKGRPHKVKQVGKVIKLLDLISQKEKLVEFSLKDFNSPALRLGYVNVDETAIYVARKPVRMMKVGIDFHNCVFVTCEDSTCPNNIKAIRDKVTLMECPEFGLMMLGHYPNLEQAFERACSFEGCVAFDKQFAVDSQGYIFFKGNHVGRYKNKAITFKPDYHYLNFFLGEMDEKALRSAFKEAA